MNLQDETLAERCRIMALHGISKDAWKRYTAEGSWYYEIVAPGFSRGQPMAVLIGIDEFERLQASAGRVDNATRSSLPPDLARRQKELVARARRLEERVEDPTVAQASKAKAAPGMQICKCNVCGIMDLY